MPQVGGSPSPDVREPQLVTELCLESVQLIPARLTGLLLLTGLRLIVPQPQTERHKDMVSHKHIQIWYRQQTAVVDHELFVVVIYHKNKKVKPNHNKLCFDYMSYIYSSHPVYVCCVLWYCHCLVFCSVIV